MDAAEKILDMLIDVPTVALLHEQRKHIVVVDLTLGSSLDFASAMLKKLPHTDLSYVGFADDEDQRAFTEEFLQQECTEQLKGGSKCIPGFTPPPEAMPSDMAVGLPPKPTMNVLTYSDKKSNLGGVLQVETLQLPEKYMKTYHDHPTYGTGEGKNQIVWKFYAWQVWKRTFHVCEIKFRKWICNCPLGRTIKES